MQIKKRHSRLITFIIGFTLFASGVIILLNHSSKNIMFYLEVTDIIQRPDQYNNKYVKIGGLVVPKSLKRNKKSGTYEFMISDCKEQVGVVYKGVLPALFRNGQGVIAHGKYENGKVYTQDLLTKHDEYYSSAKKMKLSYCGEILKY